MRGFPALLRAGIREGVVVFAPALGVVGAAGAHAASHESSVHGAAMAMMSSSSSGMESGSSVARAVASALLITAANWHNTSPSAELNE